MKEAHMKTIRYLLSLLGAAGIITALGLAGYAQSEPTPFADLDPAKCSNGTYLSNSSSRDLVSDCRALVAIRNHWTRHPDNADLPPDHPLRTWGAGDNTKMTSWDRVWIENGRVTALNLYSNAIGHTIPTEIGLLTGLTDLSLDLNDLQGVIPDEIGQLTRLVYLDLSGNDLIGNIPRSLGNLNRLEILYMQTNKLTGNIPTEFGKLRNLELLHLYANDLSGTIPRELSQISNLRSLIIGGNSISDNIPARLLRLFPFDDTLGLVLYGAAIKEYISTYKEWEVWICDVGGPIDIEQQSVTNILNTQIKPYFRWMSRGNYIPIFEFRGEVEADHEDDCFNEVLLRGEITKPTLVIDNSLSISGRAGPTYGFNKSGDIFITTEFPVSLGGATIIPQEGYAQAGISTIAHEMGHMLTFPHSFGGLLDDDTGFQDEYDNPMDMMSNPSFLLDVGTIAFNRYVAGWIDSDDVTIFDGGEHIYSLNPIGVAGTQMLVIRDPDDRFAFYTLGARVANNFDRGIPQEGVEVYRIDQSITECYDLCWGTARRTQPYPAGRSANSTDHVYEVGDTFVIEGTRVEVAKREGDRFTLRVGAETVTEPASEKECEVFEGRFCDEDGNVHESNIETIADWGITLGCGGNRFCPDQTIIRSQMAAFLYRAVTRQSGTPASAKAILEDVSQDSWYRPFAEWAVATGVMRAPNGVFNPNGVVTRADMAEMMVAAFNNLEPSAVAQGIFTDMAGQTDEVIRAAEGLRTAQVTQGCSASPLRYCPGQSVTRAQMASFFARALAS